jgi:hypothetical protein
MTWNCSTEVAGKHERILKGKERELFCHGLCCLIQEATEGATELEAAIDNIERYLDLNPGDTLGEFSAAAMFTDMPLEQQIVCAGVVAHHLTAETPIPDFAAWSEATIHAIYQAFFTAIEVEMDMERDKEEYDDDVPYHHAFWHRRRLLELVDHDWVAEIFGVEVDSETYKSGDTRLWSGIIECQANHVLWDQDFQDQAAMDATQMQKLAMEADGIDIFGPDGTYFSDAPPIDTRQNFRAALRIILPLVAPEEECYHRLGRSFDG